MRNFVDQKFTWKHHWRLNQNEFRILEENKWLLFGVYRLPWNFKAKILGRIIKPINLEYFVLLVESPWRQRIILLGSSSFLQTRSIGTCPFTFNRYKRRDIRFCWFYSSSLLSFFSQFFMSMQTSVEFLHNDIFDNRKRIIRCIKLWKRLELQQVDSNGHEKYDEISCFE